jgi:hypothetical protein
MTGISAAVASTRGTGAGKSQSGAVGLNVSEALAVVALLGIGGSRLRASVGLVA